MQWGKRWAFFMGHRRASVPLSLLPLYFFDPHVYERFIFQIFPSICRHFIRIPDWCKTFRRTLSKRSSLLSQCCFLFRFYQQCQSDVCDLFCGWLSPAPRKRTLCVLSPAIGFLLPGKFLCLASPSKESGEHPFSTEKCRKKESTDSLSLFDQFDLELNHSAELLIKIGCYILVFSVLTSFLKQTVFFGPLPTSLLCGILEITTGNHLLCQSLADSPIKTALSLAITSFGGLCAMAQTNSVIQKNGLSIFWYAGSKLFSGFFAFFLCLLWLLC